MRVLKFPRRLIRHLETPDLPLEALQSIRRLRRYLDELEAACILKARQLGASSADIGEALGITRQAVYNRLRTFEQRAETDPEFVIPDLDTEEIPDRKATPTETKLDAR
jgi:Homeodomain-like domain